MKISMVGSGYAGLVSGVCFSEFCHNVVCMHKNNAKIAALKEGRMPIFELNHDQMVASNFKSGRLIFSTDSDVLFIAVGAPSRWVDGHVHLSYVYAASKEISENLTGFDVVVIKSTVPVGAGSDEMASLSSIDRHQSARQRRVANDSFRRCPGCIVSHQVSMSRRGSVRRCATMMADHCFFMRGLPFGSLRGRAMAHEG